MKKFKYVLLFVALLGGCQTLGLAPIHKAPTAEQQAAETPAQKAERLARTALDEANATLTAINITIKQNVQAVPPLFTKAEAQDYLNESKKYGKQLDDVADLIVVGKFGDAQTQAAAIQKVLTILQQKVIAKVRKES